MVAGFCPEWKKVLRFALSKYIRSPRLVALELIERPQAHQFHGLAGDLRAKAAPHDMH